MTLSISNTLDLSLKTATPVCLATLLGRGRWSCGPHHELLDRELVDIATGKNDRLIIEMPPRHGKSVLASKYFPTWHMGRHPTHDMLLTSATADLATGFSRDVRDLLSENGHELFGVGVKGDQRAADHWKTTEGGQCRAAGVRGNIVGHGARVGVIDDFFPSVEFALSPTVREHVHKWYHGTFSHRIMRGGAIVIICTRWHADDLIGRLLKEQEFGGDQWRRLTLKAIAEDDDPLGRKPGEALWPEFEIDGDKFGFGIDWLKRKRDQFHAAGYPWQWEALFQQNPPMTIDSEWPPEYFDNIRFDEWPNRDDVIMKVTALDPSLGKTEKADYSAFVTVAKTSDGRFWVDADLGRRDSSTMLDDGMRIMDTHRPFAFGCESVCFQELLLEAFEDRMHASHLNVHPFGISNHVNKITRIRALTTLLAQKRIMFKSHSPGCELLLEQMRGFPSHLHDDGPDALEMGIRLCNELLMGTAEEEAEGSLAVPAIT